MANVPDGQSPKAVFIASPLGYSAPEPPAAEWIAEGWLAPGFRDDVTYLLSRSVSKVGSFVLAEHWLTWLSTAIAAVDAQALYMSIRDESGRLEMEWRPQFEAAFPGCQLPPAQDEAVVVGILREMIETGAGLGFEIWVQTLLKLPAAARTELDPTRPDSLAWLARKHERGVMQSLLEEARGKTNEGAQQ